MLEAVVHTYIISLCGPLLLFVSWGDGHLLTISSDNKNPLKIVNGAGTLQVEKMGSTR